MFFVDNLPQEYFAYLAKSEEEFNNGITTLVFPKAFNETKNSVELENIFEPITACKHEISCKNLKGGFEHLVVEEEFDNWTVSSGSAQHGDGCTFLRPGIYHNYIRTPASFKLHVRYSHIFCVLLGMKIYEVGVKEHIVMKVTRDMLQNGFELDHRYLACLVTQTNSTKIQDVYLLFLFLRCKNIFCVK